MEAENASMVPVEAAAAAPAPAPAAAAAADIQKAIPPKPKHVIKVTSFLKKYFPQLIVNRLFSKFAKELRLKNGYHETTKGGDFKKPLPVYYESDVPLMKAVLRDITPEVNKIAARAVRKSKRLVKNWENKVFDPEVLLKENYKQPMDDTDSEDE